MPGTNRWMPLASQCTSLDSGVHASSAAPSVTFTGEVVVDSATGEDVVVLVVVEDVVVGVVVVVMLMVALTGTIRMSAQLKYCSCGPHPRHS